MFACTRAFANTVLDIEALARPNRLELRLDAEEGTPFLDLTFVVAESAPIIEAALVVFLLLLSASRCGVNGHDGTEEDQGENLQGSATQESGLEHLVSFLSRSCLRRLRLKQSTSPQTPDAWNGALDLTETRESHPVAEERSVLALSHELAP
jgi:hypothetical protein